MVVSLRQPPLAYLDRMVARSENGEVEMADYTIELRPKRGQVELVLNMLSDVGVTEHCDGQLTVAQATCERLTDQSTPPSRR